MQRLQQQCYRFRMSLLGGNVKRSGPVLLHRRSGASHAAVRKAHVHTCIHWMRACMCVCEPIHVHLHAHITRYVHTVYTCVGIHTHTCAYTHTQTCTQDTNPKLWDARVQKEKKNKPCNDCIYIYAYIPDSRVQRPFHAHARTHFKCLRACASTSAKIEAWNDAEHLLTSLTTPGGRSSIKFDAENSCLAIHRPVYFSPCVYRYILSIQVRTCIGTAPSPLDC